MGWKNSFLQASCIYYIFYVWYFDFNTILNCAKCNALSYFNIVLLLRYSNAANNGSCIWFCCRADIPNRRELFYWTFIIVRIVFRNYIYNYQQQLDWQKGRWLCKKLLFTACSCLFYCDSYSFIFKIKIKKIKNINDNIWFWWDNKKKELKFWFNRKKK